MCVEIERVGKFDTRGDRAILLGYLTHSRGYRVFNKVTNKVEESCNVVIDDTVTHPDETTGTFPMDVLAPTSSPNSTTSSTTDSPSNRSPPATPPCPSCLDKSSSDTIASTLTPTSSGDHTLFDKAAPWVQHNHSIQDVIGNVTDGLQTRSKTSNVIHYACYTSSLEPKTMFEAIEDEEWVLAIQDELNQFCRQDV